MLTRQIQDDVNWCIFSVDDMVFVGETDAGANQKPELRRKTLLTLGCKSRNYRNSMKPRENWTSCGTED